MTLLDIFKKWFLTSLDENWKILVYRIKVSIKIILDMKYSYLKIKLPT